MNPSNLSAVLHMQSVSDFSSSSKTTLITSFILYFYCKVCICFYVNVLQFICSFFRSTAYISCRFRKDTGRSDKSSSPRASSVHGLHCHLCWFRLLLQPASLSTFCSTLMWNKVRTVVSAIAFGHLTEHIISKSSCTLPADLSVHKPEDRFPDAADPYHRYDPSILHQSLSKERHAPTSRRCSGSGNSASFALISFDRTFLQKMLQLFLAAYPLTSSQVGSCQLRNGIRAG